MFQVYSKVIQLHIHTHTFYKYVSHIFFIHSSVDGHLGCSVACLAIVNSAAINFGLHVFQIRIFVFSRYMPRSGIAGSHDNSIFSFYEKPPHLFSRVAALIYIPTNSVGGFTFFHTL